MEYNLVDVGLVAVVIALTDRLKPHIADRYVPLVPVALGFVLAVPAVVWARGPMPLSVLLSGAVLEGLKLALSAMGAFKVWHTTIKGA